MSNKTDHTLDLTQGVIWKQLLTRLNSLSTSVKPSTCVINGFHTGMLANHNAEMIAVMPK